LSTVNDRSHPIRCAITVAGIVGVAMSNSRITGSNTSTADPFAGRTYRGGLPRPIALRTAFLDTPSRRATALIGTCSAR